MIAVGFSQIIFFFGEFFSFPAFFFTQVCQFIRSSNILFRSIDTSTFFFHYTIYNILLHKAETIRLLKLASFFITSCLAPVNLVMINTSFIDTFYYSIWLITIFLFQPELKGYNAVCERMIGMFSSADWRIINLTVLFDKTLITMISIKFLI